MQVFVINLKQAVDRKRHMEKQLKKLNINYEIIEAVNGRALDDQALVEWSNFDFYQQHPTWETRGKGLIGCALSHQSIYKKIVAEKIPRAIILEDDIQMTKNMRLLFTRINELTNIDKNELILFDAISNGDKVQLSAFNRRKIAENFSLLYPINFNNLWHCSAYSISYESAAEFLKCYPKVERVADAWGAFYAKNIFSTISCVNPFASYQGDFESNIAPPKKRPTFKANARLMLQRYVPLQYLLANKIKCAAKQLLKSRYNIVNKISVLDPHYVKNER